MGAGYIIGCVLSLLIIDFNRSKLINNVSLFLIKFFKKTTYVQLLDLIIIFFIVFLLKNIGYSELYNVITGFLVTDLCSITITKSSNKTKKNFYDTVHHITTSTVCGFIAPFFYIYTFKNNVFGIAFMLIYNASLNKHFKFLSKIRNILIVIPCIIMDLLLYTVYLFTNKKTYINFKGDFLNNLFFNPTLNIDIIASHIQFINYYYFYQDTDLQYIKSYGNYKSSNVSISNIKTYLTVSYSICCFMFSLYLIIMYYI